MYLLLSQDSSKLALARLRLHMLFGRDLREGKRRVGITGSPLGSTPEVHQRWSSNYIGLSDPNSFQTSTLEFPFNAWKLILKKEAT